MQSDETAGGGELESFAARRDRIFGTTARQPFDHVCADLLPGRVLRFWEVALDRHTLRLEYELTPPLPARIEGQPPFVFWETSAEDELGGQYVDGGGAYGPARGEPKTTGVFSVQPLPAAGVRTLRVRIRAWLTPEGASAREERSCEFTVAVPARD